MGISMDLDIMINVVEHQSTSESKIFFVKLFTSVVLRNYIVIKITVTCVVLRSILKPCSIIKARCN